MGTDSTWDFSTGDGPDTEGPTIQSVTLKPNPTKGEKKVAITVNASDEDFGGSHVSGCTYVIASYDTTPYTMDQIVYGIDAEFIDTLNLDSIKLPTGNHELRFQAKDSPGNEGPEYPQALTVDPTTPPQLAIQILNDTSRQKLRVGDILQLMIQPSETLYDVFLRFENGTLYKEVTYDSLLPEPFYANISMEGIVPGEISLIAFGDNSEGKSAYTTFTFTLDESPLLRDAFAAPNPASDSVGIYYIPGDDVTARLRVFTIDGQELWSPQPQEASVGSRGVFTCDVSNWPAGLYLFVMQVSAENGQQSTVRKVFAILR